MCIRDSTTCGSGRKASTLSSVSSADSFPGPIGITIAICGLTFAAILVMCKIEIYDQRAWLRTNSLAAKARDYEKDNIPCLLHKLKAKCLSFALKSHQILLSEQLETHAPFVFYGRNLKLQKEWPGGLPSTCRK